MNRISYLSRCLNYLNFEWPYPAWTCPHWISRSTALRLKILELSSYVNFSSSTELMFTYCLETNGKVMSSNVTIRNRLKSASLCLLVKYLSWSSLINLRFGVRKCSFLINGDFELIFLADIINWNMVDRNAVTRNHYFFCLFLHNKIPRTAVFIWDHFNSNYVLLFIFHPVLSSFIIHLLELYNYKAFRTLRAYPLF